MKCRKKLLAAIMIIVMTTLSYAPTVSATSARQVTVMLDGQVVDFVDTYARIIHDYAYVPIAKVIQILTGEAPFWNDIERMASFTFRNDVYKIYISQRGIYVNDEFVEFDTGPEIADDRTMVPLRMLTNALGFEANWDNATSTVMLVSPPEPLPLALIISTTTDKPEPKPGETVAVTISATVITTMVKIVDADDNVVAESAHFTTDGAQNIFNLSFTPEEGKAYRAFASSAEGYNRESAKEVLAIESSQISDISLSTSTASPGETVSISVQASNTTSRVKLVSDLNANDVIEATSFITSGDHRIFKLDWNVRTDYYPAGTNITAKVYAGTQDAYLSTFETITVDVTSGPRIYEAFVSPSEVNANSVGTIAISTDTSVVNVSFSVINGGGSMRDAQLTTYTESGGRRRWETVYHAGATAGNTEIGVTATQSNGQTSSGVITVTVKNVSDDSRIHNMTVKPSQISVGTKATATITTGIDVQKLTCYNSLDQRTYDATSVSIHGNIRTWAYDFTVPDYAAGQTCILNATAFNGSGTQTDSNNTQFTVMQNINPADEMIYEMGFSLEHDGENIKYAFIISTGVDVTKLSCYNSMFEETFDAYGGSVSGDRKIWTYEFSVPQNAAGRDCTVTGLAYNNDIHTDSYQMDFVFSLE